MSVLGEAPLPPGISLPPTAVLMAMATGAQPRNPPQPDPRPASGNVVGSSKAPHLSDPSWVQSASDWVEDDPGSSFPLSRRGRRNSTEQLLDSEMAAAEEEKHLSGGRGANSGGDIGGPPPGFIERFIENEPLFKGY